MEHAYTMSFSTPCIIVFPVPVIIFAARAVTVVVTVTVILFFDAAVVADDALAHDLRKVSWGTVDGRNFASCDVFDNCAA